MQVMNVKTCPHCEKEFYDCEVRYVQNNIKVVWKKCDACGGTGHITTEQTIDGTVTTSWKLAYTCGKCNGSGVLDSGYFTVE